MNITNTLYSTNWLREQSGEDLINSLPKMPYFEKDSLMGHVFENPHRTTPQQAIDAKGVPSLRKLPEASVIQLAVRALNYLKGPEDHCMVIFPEFGPFTPGAVRMMLKVSLPVTSSFCVPKHNSRQSLSNTIPCTNALMRLQGEMR